MRRYRVTGPVPYRGHKPGEVFEAELTPDEERRALERGSITAVRAAARKPPPDPEEAAEDA